MPLFTVQVTVELYGDSEQDAYATIRHALAHAKKQEIVHIDSEVIATRSDEPDEGEAWAGGFAHNH